MKQINLQNAKFYFDKIRCIDNPYSLKRKYWFKLNFYIKYFFETLEPVIA